AWRSRYGWRASRPVQAMTILPPAVTLPTSAREDPLKVHAGVAVVVAAVAGVAPLIAPTVTLESANTADTTLTVHRRPRIAGTPSGPGGEGVTTRTFAA